jgi:hypothetical protein
MNYRTADRSPMYSRQICRLSKPHERVSQSYAHAQSHTKRVVFVESKMRTSLFISGGAGFPSSSLVDASVDAAVVSPPVDRRTMRVVWARLPVTRPYVLRPVVVVVDATRVVARRVVVGIFDASVCGARDPTIHNLKTGRRRHNTCV